MYTPQKFSSNVGDNEDLTVKILILIELKLTVFKLLSIGLQKKYFPPVLLLAQCVCMCVRVRSCEHMCTYVYLCTHTDLIIRWHQNNT